MNKRTIVSVLAFCLCCGVLWAQTPNSGDDFDIRQNAQGGITITGYRGTSRSVVIPQTIEGIRVTIIGEGAFKNKNLTSVVIPNTVITIEKQAFGPSGETSLSNNNSIQSLVIPNSVTTIGESAFNDCGIHTLTLGNNVATIGDHAFNSNNIAEVQFPSSVNYIGYRSFDNNKIKSLTLPRGAKVGTWAFRRNEITSIVIPSGYEGNYMLAPFFLRHDDERRIITSATLPANLDVFIIESSISDALAQFYESQGRKAGTYTFSGRIWSVR